MYVSTFAGVLFPRHQTPGLRRMPGLPAPGPGTAGLRPPDLARPGTRRPGFPASTGVAAPSSVPVPAPVSVFAPASVPVMSPPRTRVPGMVSAAVPSGTTAVQQTPR
ncbi:hypothetical protein GCM10010515_67960 [Streptomyces fructofermentans]|uniref:Uncharacterized protein n=1 Tax=Streptomyces fructofermentans TaxID=152141 RepID=A0A918NS11_9ACTN|nr:hypothetical protein GCM10010515_67960 [Streptomyces fructofermentans]